MVNFVMLNIVLQKVNLVMLRVECVYICLCLISVWWWYCSRISVWISCIRGDDLSQEPLSALASEYQSGSPILLEKIKVVNLSVYGFIGFDNCDPLKIINYCCICRFLVSSMLPLGVHEEMETVSFEVLCSPILYVSYCFYTCLISIFEILAEGKLICSANLTTKQILSC